MINRDRERLCSFNEHQAECEASTNRNPAGCEASNNKSEHGYK